MDDTRTQLKSSDHVVSVHRVNGPAQYPTQWSVSEFGTKYQAQNMELEAVNIANYDAVQNSLVSDKLRYQYDKLKTADSDGDKPQSSEETRSKISGSDNPEGISSLSHHNVHWHRKSSTKYPTIRGQQNPHFSSGDEHHPETFQKLTQTADQLGALDVGTNPRGKKHAHGHHAHTHPHTHTLEVQRKGANNQRTADKVNTYSFKSGHGLVGSSAMKFLETTEDEAERNKPTQDYIHSRTEALKASTKREIGKAERDKATREDFIHSRIEALKAAAKREIDAERNKLTDEL
jgi:hypothetical protein